ncbi:24704_t:CDS:2, partial [Gigaspora margarita]
GRQVSTKSIIDTLAKYKKLLKVDRSRAKAFVPKKQKAFSQIYDKNISKIIRTATILSNEEVEPNFFGKVITENDNRDNINNIKTNTSIQKIDNGQNNNKEHLIEFNSESSRSLQHRFTDTGHIITEKDLLKTNMQINKDQIPITENRKSPLVKQ